jgi:hypothetical protein
VRKIILTVAVVLMCSCSEMDRINRYGEAHGYVCCFGGGAQMCPICGAGVYDIEKHTEWHRKHGEVWEVKSR